MAKLAGNSLPARLPIGVIPARQSRVVFSVSVSAITSDGETVNGTVKIASSFTSVPNYEQAHNYYLSTARPALKAYLESLDDDALFDLEATEAQIEV